MSTADKHGLVAGKSLKFWNIKHPKMTTDRMIPDLSWSEDMVPPWTTGYQWMRPRGRVVRVAGHVAVRNGRRDPNWRNNVGLLIRWLHPDGAWRHVQIDCGKTFRESVMLWYKEHQAGWGWGKIYEIWIMNETYWKISLDISALKKNNNKNI